MSENETTGEKVKDCSIIKLYNLILDMSEKSYCPDGANGQAAEIKFTPALTTREKLQLEFAVMESYGIHHDEKHPGNPLSMKWVTEGAGNAFRELLDEKNLSPEDMKEVELVKAAMRKGNLGEAVKRCHELLSKKFSVASSLEPVDKISI